MKGALLALLCLATCLMPGGADAAAAAGFTVIALDMEVIARPGGGFVCPGTDWGWDLAAVEAGLGVALEAMSGGMTAEGPDGPRFTQTFGTPQDSEVRFSIFGQLGFGYFQFLDGGLVSVDLTFLTNQRGMESNDLPLLYDSLSGLLTAACAAPTQVDCPLLTERDAVALRWTAEAEGLEGITAVQVGAARKEGEFFSVTLTFSRVGFME